MDQTYQNLVARRIKSSLKEANMSQTDLSNMLEKSKAYVSNITKGRYVPKINELIRISELVKKPIGYFFGEDTPGLMHYVDKAKKWDKLVGLIDKELSVDSKKNINPIPLIDLSKTKGKTRKELFELKDQTKEFIYFSETYIRNFLKYFKPIENLFAVKVFIRDYPEFGVNIGDLNIYESMNSNDIGNDTGKLFGVFYGNKVGLKRIYNNKNEYYFEPMHSEPQIDKILASDPNLLIAGKLIYNLNLKTFL